MLSKGEHGSQELKGLSINGNYFPEGKDQFGIYTKSNSLFAETNTNSLQKKRGTNKQTTPEKKTPHMCNPRTQEIRIEGS